MKPSGNDTALREKVAMVMLSRQGFGFYSDPMEGGQDAYDITQDALADADAIIAVLPNAAQPPTTTEEPVADVNVLLEKIAVTFDYWETFNLFRSEAAANVRSFKHDSNAAQSSLTQEALADFICEVEDRLGPGCDELAVAQAILRKFNITWIPANRVEE